MNYKAERRMRKDSGFTDQGSQQVGYEGSWVLLKNPTSMLEMKD